jgi:hypothetical protein
MMLVSVCIVWIIISGWQFVTSTLVTRNSSHVCTTPFGRLVMSHSTGHSPPSSPAPLSVAQPSVAAVTIKLPPFWPADPDIWFAQVDAHFATRRITSQKSRFDYVIASLAPEYAAEVRDLILNPPDTNPYDTLRFQLIQRTTPSQQKRLQQLLSIEELGDRTPSQLLRRLQQLLGDKPTATDSAILREVFLQRLPANVRMILAANPSDSLESLATLADRLMEVATPPLVSLVDSTPPSTELEQLRNEVDSLKQLVQSLSSQSPTQPCSPSPRRRPSSPLQRQYCWYHSRFSSKATKCQKPCSWDSENLQAGR